jgi:hypothetical protein
LRRVARWDTGRAFYPGGVAPFQDGKFAGGAYVGHYPNVISPLVHYWQSCGDPEALAFAEAMTEGFLSDLQPGHLHQADGHVHGHSHLQMHAVRGVAQLGALTQNWRYLDWAKRAYDFFHVASFDTGWVPEHHWLAGHRDHSETCLVADMLEIAIWLARAGRPRLWDRVDRIVRNYLSPTQFSVTPEFKAFWVEVNQDKSLLQIANGLAGLRELEGGFLSGVTPNDCVIEAELGKMHHGMTEAPPLLTRGRRGFGIMVEMAGCCPPSAMRALYLSWANTVLRTPQGVMVNLALDHDGSEARVDSGLPRCGRLSVTPKTTADFWLRPPAWVPRGQVQAWRDGQSVEPRWGGPAHDYLAFPTARPGELLELAWPLVRFRQRVTQKYMENSEAEIGHFVEGETYTFDWTGSTVTGVEPQGKWLPLYA